MNTGKQLDIAPEVLEALDPLQRSPAMNAGKQLGWVTEGEAEDERASTEPGHERRETVRGLLLSLVEARVLQRSPAMNAGKQPGTCARSGSSSSRFNGARP